MSAPSAVANPKALLPANMIPWILLIRRSGDKRSVSRVPGDPPLIATLADAPLRASTTVQPVPAFKSVKWPAVRPFTDVIVLFTNSL